jgi:hypothetical protein
MSTADEILLFSENFSLYFTITIFIIGIIGSILNLLVLTTLKLFRSNQCIFYLIVESIVNIGQLSILFIIYFLTLINGSDPENVSLIWCKMKNILPQLFRLLSTSMVCFAAFDQFLSTNPRFSLRQLSTLRLARRLTIISICIWALHCIPYGIFYRIVSSLGCINTSVQLVRYYSDFYYPFLHGFLPIFMSVMFSLLAYRNVRHLVRLQVPVERRKLDKQLTAMIFVRVIAFIILLLPYTVYRIYSLNVTINQANVYAYAVSQLTYSIMSSFTNLNYAVRFCLISGEFSCRLLF